jgi:YfiH family protein
MEFVTLNTRRYVRFAGLAALPGLAHAWSLRPTDVGPRTGAGDAPAAAARADLVRDLGGDPDRLTYALQVHGRGLALVDAATPPGAVAEVDALVTTQVGRPLMTFSADCPLIVVYDPGRRVLGMVHASWRCTVARATRQLVETMVARGGCEPVDLWAGIGPSAGPCCYEVQEDVRAAARASLPEADRFFPTRGGRMTFDLWTANRAELLAAGLRDERIEVTDLCTMCRADLFFSYRREGRTGRFELAAVMV